MSDFSDLLVLVIVIVVTIALLFYTCALPNAPPFLTKLFSKFHPGWHCPSSTQDSSAPQPSPTGPPSSSKPPMHCSSAPPSTPRPPPPPTSMPEICQTKWTVTGDQLQNPSAPSLPNAFGSYTGQEDKDKSGDKWTVNCWRFTAPVQSFPDCAFSTSPSKTNLPIRQASICYIPEKLDPTKPIPFVVLVGWENPWNADSVSEDQLKNAKVSASDAGDCVLNPAFEAPIGNLGRALGKEAWVIVYLFPWAYCRNFVAPGNSDSTGKCHGVLTQKRDWAFAGSDKQAATRFYCNGNQYEGSIDEAYIQTLFDVNSADSIYQHMITTVQASKQTRSFGWGDYVEGFSTAGFSSCAAFASRIIEESRKSITQLAPTAHIPRVKAAVLDASFSWRCYGEDIQERNGPPEHDPMLLAQCDAYYQAYLKNMNAWNTYCGKGTSNGVCPFSITEPAYDDHEEAYVCHPKVLVQSLTDDSFSDNWGSFLYAQRLTSKGIPSASLRCAKGGGACHGLVWSCTDPTPYIQLDVIWLNYYGNASGDDAALQRVSDSSFYPFLSCTPNDSSLKNATWHTCHKMQESDEYWPSGTIDDKNECTQTYGCCYDNEGRCGIWALNNLDISKNCGP